jgi:hypothetical protein
MPGEIQYAGAIHRNETRPVSLISVVRLISGTKQKSPLEAARPFKPNDYGSGGHQCWL